MKKLLKLIGVASALALLAGVTGCKSEKKSNSSTGTKKLTFWTFQNAHAEFMKDAAKSWNEKNPNEQIDLAVEVLGYDEMHNKLLIALQSGSGAPDISDIEIGKFANYLKGKNPPLVKLNDMLDMEHLIKGRFNPYTKNGNIYGVDYHVGAAVIYYNKEILDAEDYRKRIDIKTPSINQTVGNLSGGNQQKVVLAKWMLTQPEVLILDEPTRGIDVNAKYEIYCVINELAKSGKGVIVISSEMPEIIGTCDRVYVINDGEIAGDLQKADINQINIMKCIMQHNNKKGA